MADRSRSRKQDRIWDVAELKKYLLPDTTPFLLAYGRELQAVRSQLLQISHGGRTYRLVVKHATFEHYPTKFYGAPPEDWFRGVEHTHPVYHIVLYVEGESYFMYGGKRRQIRPNTLVLASPGEPHLFHAIVPSSIVYTQVCFALECEEGACELPFHELLSLYSGIDLAPARFPIRLSDRQAYVLRRMLEVLPGELNGQSELSYLSASTTILDILLFLIAEIYLGHRAERRTGDVSLLAAKQFIEEHYAEPISREEIAGVASLSVAQFHRAYRAEFGTSPMAYQRELRIMAAKQLLENTGLRTKEIARQVGYNDVYYFSRVFRRLTGVPPTDYRKRARKSGDGGRRKP